MFGGDASELVDILKILMKNGQKMLRKVIMVLKDKKYEIEITTLGNFSYRTSSELEIDSSNYPELKDKSNTEIQNILIKICGYEPF